MKSIPESSPIGGPASNSGAALRWLWQRALPLIVSIGLLAWLLQIVSLRDLVGALSNLDWHLLAPLTALMVAVLYFWDSVCLQVLFVVDDRLVPLKQSLAVRAKSYLLGAINYQLGQGAIAWGMAKLQNTSFLSALSRSVLLAYHDLFVLLTAGLIGATFGEDPRLARIQMICSVGLGILLAVTGGLFLVCKRYGRWIRRTKWGAWIDSWSWRRSLQLSVLRVIYFGTLVFYASLALRICRIAVDWKVAVSAIPVVLLADGLPSVTGLGTREAALLLLLDPPQPERLLAMSLVWSSGMIFGRFAIGLLALWVSPSRWTQPSSSHQSVFSDT